MHLLRYGQYFNGNIVLKQKCLWQLGHFHNANTITVGINIIADRKYKDLILSFPATKKTMTNIGNIILKIRNISNDSLFIDFITYLFIGLTPVLSRAAKRPRLE